MQTYDLIVVGAGSAGLSAAKGAALLGLKVALVEKEHFGGDCLWTGCVPSKSLIHSAKVAHTLDTAKDYGFHSVKYKPKFSDVMKRVWDVIYSIERHDSPDAVKHAHVTPITGKAQFVTPHIIEVDGKRYKGRKFLICTGSRAFVPSIEGIDKLDYLTNETVFKQKTLPKSLIVVGGGPIGVEMAQAFMRLGSQVVVIHSGEHLLDKEDDDIGREITSILKKEGLKVITNSRVVKADRDGIKNIIYAKNKSSGRTTKVTGSTVLIATGRQRNLDLNLEAAGVKYDERGGIEVNNKLRTSARHIYAAGDVTNHPYMFTHVADYHARIAVQNICFKFGKKVDYRALPWVTFTDPEVARVGLGEKQAIEKGVKYKAYTVQFADNDRAEAEGETAGLLKVLVDKKGRLLGAHIIGPHAGELLGEFTLAVYNRENLAKLGQMVHAYPTLSLIMRQVAGLYGRDKLEQFPFIKKLARLLVKL